MLRVRCQSHVTVDAKGRLALPAALRRAMTEHEVQRLVLTFHKQAIWGWTLDDFERRVESPLSAADPFDQNNMDFVHSVMAPAQDVDIDGQGRIRIPPMLRDLAGVERDVVIHSVLHRIEIWEKSAWEQRFRQSLQRVSERSGMPGGDAR
jgi:MraZ protein